MKNAVRTMGFHWWIGFAAAISAGTMSMAMASESGAAPAERIDRSHQEHKQSSASTVPDEGEWTYQKGKGYVVCDALLKRLKQYRYRSQTEALDCSGAVIATWPGWKEPPWEELDPRKHEALIYQLMRLPFDEQRRLPGREIPQPGEEEDIHASVKRKVKRFIDDGGRIQVWRTRFTESYGMGPAPPGPQTVVQLRWMWNERDLKEFHSTTCPGKPHPGWGGSVYLVKDDLSRPLPGVHPFYEHAFGGATVFLFGGRIHLIYRTAVSHYPSYALNFCELIYKPRRK
jgi:hypothetical protein